MTDAPTVVNSIVKTALPGHHKRMKTFGPGLFLLLSLGACGSLSLYYRPGVTVARQQSDATRCEVQALKDAPVNTQLKQGPPVFYPGGRYCRGGSCWSYPGYWDSGALYTVDVNRDLRRRVMDMCMADKGYRPVTIPPCPQSVKSRAAPGRTTTLPKLTAESCFIRNADDSYQIVTPQISSTSG